MKNFLKASAFLIIAGGLSIIPNISNLWTSYEYMKETIRGAPVLTSNKEIRSSGLDKDYITQWSYGVGETFTLMIPDVKGGGSTPLFYDEFVSLYNGTAKEKRDAREELNKYPKPFIDQLQNHLQGRDPIDGYWGDMPFTGGPVYVGAFLCFLFILGLFIVKGRLKWALFGVTILAILLSWGHNLMPFTDFFINYVPFYNKFRAVSSILIIVEITIPLLAILALKEITDNPKLLKENKWFFFVSLGLTAGLTLLFVLLPSTFFSFIKDSETAQFNEYIKQGANKNQVDDFLSNIELARISIFKMSCLRSIAFILIGAGLLWLYASMKKMSKYVLYAGVALLILIDLVTVDKKYLNDKDFQAKNKIETPFVASTADNAILQDTTKDFRVLNLTVGDFTREASASYFHKSIGGYHAAKLRRYQDLIENRLIQEHDRLVKTLQANVPDSVLISTLYGLTSLNMLNTKYYIYNPDASPMRNPAALGNAWFVDKVTLVNNADEEIKAIDNFIPANNAVVDKRFEKDISMFKGDRDPQSTIILKDYTPNHLTYETKNLKTNQLAVFSEIYYDKGWNAYIDGVETPYFRANYVLRAMVVPAGNHKIEFKFEPKSYFTGEKISFAGSVLIILIIGAALFFEFRKKKNPLQDNIAKKE